MQLILVGIVIAFPQTVTVFLDKAQVIDLNKATDMRSRWAIATRTFRRTPAAAASAPGAGALGAVPSRHVERRRHGSRAPRTPAGRAEAPSK